MRITAIILVLLLVIPFAASRELSRGSVEEVPAREAPVTLRMPEVQQMPSARGATLEVSSVQGITQEMINAQNARLEVLKQNALVTLACPEPARHVVTMPKMPVPEGSDDCELIGKSAEIEAYLKSLEAVAAECNARREASYKNALLAKQKLDKQIDQLLLTPPDLPKGWKSPPICGINSPGIDITSDEYSADAQLQYYTIWLKFIGSNVKEYCEIIETQFISGIANACKVMNKEIPCIIDYYEGVKDTDKAAFHAKLNGELNALNKLYTYTDSLYKRAIVEYGIGNLRKYYNESNLDCGTLTPAQISIARKQIEIASLKNALPAQSVQQPLQHDNIVIEELPSWGNAPTGAITYMRMWGAPMYVKRTVNSSQGFAGPCETYREGNKTKFSCITPKLGRGSTFPIGISPGLYAKDMAAGRIQQCVRGATRCTNSTYERCVGGFWISTEQCGKSETCTTGGCRIISGYYSARQRAMITKGYAYNANVHMTGGFV